MIVTSSENSVEVNYDELATLKELAKRNALKQEIKISNSEIAEELAISTQTASRRLRKLGNVGLISRQPVNDGQLVSIEPEGREMLRQEYKIYRSFFGSRPQQDITLSGHVVEGMKEAKHYLSLSGYRIQFVEKLGYEPYPGTLNVRLDDSAIRKRAQLNDVEPISISEWEDEERTYGSAECYPANLKSESGSFDPVHLIVPDRTHHDEDEIELLAPECLREKLGLETNDNVTVSIKRSK